MKAIRFLIAPVAGILAFMFGVMALEAVGHAIYPPPAEIEALSRAMGDAMAAGDTDRYREVQAEMTPVLSAWLGDAPVGALLAVVLAWIGGGVVGALVAAVIAPAGKIWFALLVGAFDVVASSAQGGADDAAPQCSSALISSTPGSGAGRSSGPWALM